MTVESDIFDTLKTLVSNRVFPDVAPWNTTRPYITYQQIGGKAINYIDPTAPDLRHGMYQVNCWDDTRLAANALARQVEAAFRAATIFQSRPDSDILATHEPDLNRYGTIQDFSIWSGV